jgi:hypothetical protein
MKFTLEPGLQLPEQSLLLDQFTRLAHPDLEVHVTAEADDLHFHLNLGLKRTILAMARQNLRPPADHAGLVRLLLLGFPEGARPEDPEKLWSHLNRTYGEPEEVSNWPEERQREAASQQTVFWITTISDGHGSGDVYFRLATPSDDFKRERGRGLYTFGVPLRPEWLELLDSVTWDRLSDSDYWREKHLQ